MSSFSSGDFDPDSIGLWWSLGKGPVHPNAPAGAGGAGRFKSAQSLGRDQSILQTVPHPNSAVGRALPAGDVEKQLANAKAAGSSEDDLLGPYIGKDYAKTTKSVGDGFCVPLVQQIAGAPQTTLWTAGDDLSDKPELVEGTAIATFNDEGKYESKATGNHAAIFVKYDKQNGKDGIVIFDQYREWAKDPKYGKNWDVQQKGESDDDFKKRKEAVEKDYPEVDSKARRFRRKQPGNRFISFDAKGGNPSNNASAYSVIRSEAKPSK